MLKKEPKTRRKPKNLVAIPHLLYSRVFVPTNQAGVHLPHNDTSSCGSSSDHRCHRRQANFLCNLQMGHLNLYLKTCVIMNGMCSALAIGKNLVRY